MEKIQLDISKISIPKLRTITLTLFTFFFCTINFNAQSQSTHNKIDRSNYTIQPATRWTQLFNRQTGWTGGDGIYSIKLPKSFKNNLTRNKKAGDILFLFSDSVIDTLMGGKPSSNGFTMIHNAVAILNGTTADDNALHFYWPTNSAKKPASVFMPAGQFDTQGKPVDDSIYYWLGDGISYQPNNNKKQDTDTALAIFSYKMINTSSAPFGFKDIDNELLLTDVNFNVLKSVKIPVLASGNFGAGIYKETFKNKKTKKTASSADAYIYIYGVRGPHKGLVVARTNNNDLANPANWQYLSAGGWSKDIQSCIEIAAHVSNELSITRTPSGQYALIYQLDGIQPYIGMQLAPTPYGPFGRVDTIWHCAEPTPTNKLLVYNAKAHPSLSPKGKMLISYNVNSLDFLNKLREEPTFYRPRFLWLTWK